MWLQHISSIMDTVRITGLPHPPPPLLQFVPFRDYIDRSGNQVLSMARLAKDVLAEIPDQLLSFMKSRGIEPRPALSTSSLPELHMWLPHTQVPFSLSSHYSLLSPSSRHLCRRVEKCYYSSSLPALTAGFHPRPQYSPNFTFHLWFSTTLHLAMQTYC